MMGENAPSCDCQEDVTKAYDNNNADAKLPNLFQKYPKFQKPCSPRLIIHFLDNQIPKYFSCFEDLRNDGRISKHISKKILYITVSPLYGVVPDWLLASCELQN